MVIKCYMSVFIRTELWSLQASWEMGPDSPGQLCTEEMTITIILLMSSDIFSLSNSLNHVKRG